MYQINNKSQAEKPSVEQTKKSEVLYTDKYDVKLDKSNILMLGPTGSGKTLLACKLIFVLNLFKIFYFLLIDLYLFYFSNNC